MVDADKLIGGGAALLLFVLAYYAVVVRRLYLSLRPETHSLSVLVARLACFLPLYALLMFVVLVSPQALDAVEVPISLVEGYSFLLFLSLIVRNLNGPVNTVRVFAESEKPLVCCASCCPADPIQYYKRTAWAMLHLVSTRVILVAVALIVDETGTQAGAVCAALLHLLAAAMIFYCITKLVLLYENIFTHLTNLFGVAKFVLLKFSVKLMVFQNVVVSFILASKTESHSDTVRIYAMLTLVEFAVLCVPYLWAFTYTISDPPEPIHDETTAYPIRFTSFLLEVLNVFDVCGSLTYDDEQHVPLTAIGTDRF